MTSINDVNWPKLWSQWGCCRRSGRNQFFLSSGPNLKMRFDSEIKSKKADCYSVFGYQLPISSVIYAFLGGPCLVITSWRLVNNWNAFLIEFIRVSSTRPHVWWRLRVISRWIISFINHVSTQHTPPPHLAAVLVGDDPPTVLLHLLFPHSSAWTNQPTRAWCSIYPLRPGHPRWIFGGCDSFEMKRFRS